MTGRLLYLLYGFGPHIQLIGYKLGGVSVTEQKYTVKRKSYFLGFGQPFRCKLSRDKNYLSVKAG